MVVRSLDKRIHLGWLVGGHLVVSLIAISLFCANGCSSGMWYQGDSSRHAMNGVFYMDMIGDAGFLHPKKYAERYYVQYPAIDPVHYPPAFYLIEAALFKLLGVSASSARLTVLLFTLIGVNLFLAMCRMWFPPWLAMCGGMLFLLQPGMALYQQWVMLDVPSVSMTVLAIYVFYVGLETGNRWALFFAPICGALAVLTKVQAVFLLFVYMGWMTIRRKWAFAKSIHLLAGVVTGALLVAPWIAVHLFASSDAYLELFFGQAGEGSTILARGCYYLKHLPLLLSYPVILVYLLALVFFAQLKAEDCYLLAAVWCLGVLLLVMSYPTVEWRYSMYIVPPVIVSCLAFTALLEKRVRRFLGKGCMGWIVMGIMLSLHLSPEKLYGLPDIRGFGEAVDFVQKALPPGAVLYDGQFNGNFIFQMRAQDENRRIFVFTGNKVIYSIIYWSGDYSEYVKKEDDFYELLDQYGIKFVVLEEAFPRATPAARRIREWTKGNRFKLVREVDMVPDVYTFNRLRIYEYLDYAPRALKRIEIEMPRMGSRITVDLGGALRR